MNYLLRLYDKFWDQLCEIAKEKGSSDKFFLDWALKRWIITVMILGALSVFLPGKAFLIVITINTFLSIAWIGVCILVSIEVYPRSRS